MSRYEHSGGESYQSNNASYGKRRPDYRVSENNSRREYGNERLYDNQSERSDRKERYENSEGGNYRIRNSSYDKNRQDYKEHSENNSRRSYGNSGPDGHRSGGNRVSNYEERSDHYEYSGDGNYRSSSSFYDKNRQDYKRNPEHHSSSSDDHKSGSSWRNSRENQGRTGPYVEKDYGHQYQDSVISGTDGNFRNRGNSSPGRSNRNIYHSGSHEQYRSNTQMDGNEYREERIRHGNKEGTFQSSYHGGYDRRPKNYVAESSKSGQNYNSSHGNYQNERSYYNNSSRGQNFRGNDEYEKVGKNYQDDNNRYQKNTRGFSNDPTEMGNDAKASKRAPRDWVPSERDVEELINETARKVGDCEISGDQAVEVRNSDIDTRLNSWANSGLHKTLLKNLELMGYTAVRAIQAAMIPQILAGYDVIGQAETSAGKTAAFGLPIVHHILQMDKETRQISKEQASPFALILSPTRELAGQTYDNLRQYSKGTDIYVRLSYGQQDRKVSLREINVGCDILVGTCGRVMDFVNKSDISLRALRFLVLDEADRLLQDFKKDPLGHLGTIFDNHDFIKSASYRQTVMTSATFDRSVEIVASKLMKPLRGEADVVRIVLSRAMLSDRVNLTFKECRGLFEKHQEIKSILQEKNDRGETPKTLIFVQRKQQCDHLAVKLSIMGFSSETLHGDRTQDLRDKVINDFKHGELHVLVTTDVLSRGIDVTDLERVINFDLPNGSVDSATDTFIHRSGRTGRINSGVCISFVDPTMENDCRLSPKLVELVESQGRGNTIPEFLSSLARANAYQARKETGYGGSFGGSFGGSTPFPGSGFVSGSDVNKTGGSRGGAFGSSTGTFGSGTNNAFARRNDEPSFTVVGSFGASKSATGFGSATDEKNTLDLGASSFGFASKTNSEAKEAANGETFGTSTFKTGNGSEDKDVESNEEDEW